MTPKTCSTRLTGIGITDKSLTEWASKTGRAVAEPGAARVVLGAHGAVLAGLHGAGGVLTLHNVPAGAGRGVQVNRKVIDLQKMRLRVVIERRAG